MTLSDDELRALAMAATPGPWYGDKIADIWTMDHVYVAGADNVPEFGWDQTRKNGHYIAAANPATILSLLDRVKAAEAENIELRDNSWPHGKRPNPVVGHIFDDFSVYGDEKSMKLVRAALHEYQAMMPARIERIQEQAAQISTLEAENKRLRGALMPFAVITDGTQPNSLSTYDFEQARRALENSHD